MVIPRLIRQQSTKPFIIYGLEQLQNKAVADYVPPIYNVIIVIVVIIISLFHNKQPIHQLTSLYIIGDLLLYPPHQELVLLVIHLV